MQFLECCTSKLRCCRERESEPDKSCSFGWCTAVKWRSLECLQWWCSLSAAVSQCCQKSGDFKSCLSEQECDLFPHLAWTCICNSCDCCGIYFVLREKVIFLLNAWKWCLVHCDQTGNWEKQRTIWRPGARVGRFCFLVNLLSTQAELESVLQFQK